MALFFHVSLLVLLLNGASAQTSPTPARRRNPPPPVGVSGPPTSPSPPPSPSPVPPFLIDIQNYDSQGNAVVPDASTWSAFSSGASDLFKANNIAMSGPIPIPNLAGNTLQVFIPVLTLADLNKASDLMASTPGAQDYIKRAGLEPCTTKLFATNAGKGNTPVQVYGCEVLSSVDTTTCTCCWSDKPPTFYELTHGLISLVPGYPSSYPGRVFTKGVVIPKEFRSTSVAWCAQQAAAANSQYYGLEYEYECWYFDASTPSDVAFSKATRYGSANNCHKCEKGDGSCGGWWSLALYARY